jgi:hypothetical protein
VPVISFQAVQRLPGGTATASAGPISQGSRILAALQRSIPPLTKSDVMVRLLMLLVHIHVFEIRGADPATTNPLDVLHFNIRNVRHSVLQKEKKRKQQFNKMK